MELKIIKNSEKIIIWMHRNNKTINDIAAIIGKTRQSVSKKLNENTFTEDEIAAIKRALRIF